MGLSYIQRVLEKLDRLCQTKGWTRKTLASRLGIPLGTVEKWFIEGSSPSKREPSLAHLEKIHDLLTFEEAHERAENLKYLLLLVERELRWFRDSSAAAREVLRQELDTADVGYISSLLAMIGEEEKLGRWLAFTTYKFNYFRKRG